MKKYYINGAKIQHIITFCIIFLPILNEPILLLYKSTVFQVQKFIYSWGSSNGSAGSCNSC